MIVIGWPNSGIFISNYLLQEQPASEPLAVHVRKLSYKNPIINFKEVFKLGTISSSTQWSTCLYKLPVNWIYIIGELIGSKIIGNMPPPNYTSFRSTSGYARWPCGFKPPDASIRRGNRATPRKTPLLHHLPYWRYQLKNQRPGMVKTLINNGIIIILGWCRILSINPVLSLKWSQQICNLRCSMTFFGVSSALRRRAE